MFSLSLALIAGCFAAFALAMIAMFLVVDDDREDIIIPAFVGGAVVAVLVYGLTELLMWINTLSLFASGLLWLAGFVGIVVAVVYLVSGKPFWRSAGIGLATSFSFIGIGYAIASITVNG